MHSPVFFKYVFICFYIFFCLVHGLCSWCTLFRCTILGSQLVFLFVQFLLAVFGAPQSVDSIVYREGTQSTESTWLKNAVGCCTLRDYTALRDRVFHMSAKDSFTQSGRKDFMSCIDATKPGSAFSSREGGSAWHVENTADGCGWMWLWVNLTHCRNMLHLVT